MHSTQMIVVTTSSWNAVDGRLQRFERNTSHEKWEPVGKPISIVVGRNGMGWGIGLLAPAASGIRAAADPVKREGDGRSPAGIFTLGTAFGYASQPLPGLKLPYLSLTASTECVDDVHSKHYNRIVDRSTVSSDWNSSEHMRDAGRAYQWGVVIDHNSIVKEGGGHPPVPAGGSCVFMHIWSGPGQGTAGCTAMPQSELEGVLLWLDSARKPLLVQLPAADYARLSPGWELPLISGQPHR
ncbi:L,D-transpeptidase family protein [Terracidiphilus sp.]|uniref:L,D-transpeptidase family protein n=1 Tax=Terracidiphilus sp. TaxID=1964191 RepID=UPI003C27C5CB